MGSFGDELNEVRRDNTGSPKCNVDMGYYGNEIFILMKGVKIWRKKNKDFCAIHSFPLHALSPFLSDSALRAASGGSSPLPTAGPVTLNSPDAGNSASLLSGPSASGGDARHRLEACGSPVRACMCVCPPAARSCVSHGSAASS